MSVSGHNDLHKYGEHPIEVKSPALFAGQEAYDEVRRVSKILSSTYRINRSTNCGLHVHVGNQDLGFSNEVRQNLIGLLYTFEPQLQTLHRRHRLNNFEFCGSLREESQLGRYALSPKHLRVLNTTGVLAVNFLNLQTEHLDFHKENATWEPTEILKKDVKEDSDMEMPDVSRETAGIKGAGSGKQSKMPFQNFKIYEAIQEESATLLFEHAKRDSRIFDNEFKRFDQLSQLRSLPRYEESCDSDSETNSECQYKKTVEFRQHEATLDPNVILNWIVTTVGLVNFARHSKVNQPSLEDWLAYNIDLPSSHPYAIPLPTLQTILGMPEQAELYRQRLGNCYLGRTQDHREPLICEFESHFERLGGDEGPEEDNGLSEEEALEAILRWEAANCSRTAIIPTKTFPYPPAPGTRERLVSQMAFGLIEYRDRRILRSIKFATVTIQRLLRRVIRSVAS
ncbi:hypothetical protein B0O99DRAFT_741847 [Bisporella sp. PMI_857]|nr:hypothetical protein B0O99DRAFT_741847 [Bisporella sp. PMI_857]